ncbi:hypothetical protein [Archaeoglobus sp.]
MDELKKYRRLIQKILEAFTDVPFTVVVESVTGKSVEPIDLNDPKDKILIEDISRIADKIMMEFSKKLISLDEYRKLRGKASNVFRPNEVSVFLEIVFPNKFEEIRKDLKTIESVIHLKRSGYPDVKLIDKFERCTFLEIKATTRPDSASPRDFFSHRWKIRRKRSIQMEGICFWALSLTKLNQKSSERSVGSSSIFQKYWLV